MTKIDLIISKKPLQAEVYVRLMQKDGILHRRPAMIDTGAEISLFPIELLSIIITNDAHEEVILEQAGIAGQEFKGIEAIVEISLEDMQGNISDPFSIRAWFADTDRWILGMTNAIEHGILHLDLPAQSGYIELP